MLLSKTAIVKWNAKIKKHYVDLGYQYTKMGDEFEIKVDDLTKGSSALVKVQCDYCQRIYDIRWNVYKRSRDKVLIHLDCCGNPECTGKKAHEALHKKYGVNSIWQVEEILNKRNQTNLEKYGCINPFGNKEIQEKITQTLYRQNGYGKRRSSEALAKAKATCLERYGVDNKTKTAEYREKTRGENSPRWKGDKVLHQRLERGLPEYRDWRKAVFDRDRYTCQCCGARNGKGKYVRLEAHHIFDFKNHKDKIFDVDNGITLCDKCHTKFHSDYGKHGNNKQQLDDFLFKYKTLQRMKRYAELMGIETIRAMG